MLELTTYTELEIAHRLITSYAQKCRALHGHRYEVEITVTSKYGSLNQDGMIVDFKKLKEIVKCVLDDPWDHGACFNAADPLVPALLADDETSRLHIVDANPTLEWMVETWARDLQGAFDAAQLDLRLERLKASETAKNTVTWTRNSGSGPAIDPNKPKGPVNVPIQSARIASVDRPKSEMETEEFRTRREMVLNLSNKTGVGIGECRETLIDCDWDFARAHKKLEYLRSKGIRGCRLAPADECQVKEPPKTEVTRIEVAVAASKPEDELRDDEEAYLVSYWPVGYSQPVSGVFATAMRGIALVRALKAAVDERHPNGATLISFNRVPR